MKPIKKAALLHSMCSVGKASLSNMIPVLSSMGIEACPIPTILLSTHTGGYGIPAMQHISTEYVRACADHYKNNQVLFDLVFVGYLGSADMVSAVQYFLDCFPNATVILDPILGDYGTYYSNLGPEYIQAFKKLLPYADIILPNLTEACLLTETPYAEDLSKQEITDICENLHHAGANQVVVTSVPSEEQQKGVVLSTKEGVEYFVFHKEKEDFHGSGDVFDAVFIGSLLNEKPINECLTKAHSFVCACIRESSKYDYHEREGLLVEKNLSLLV